MAVAGLGAVAAPVIDLASSGAKSLFASISDALKTPVLHIKWERNPKNFKKMIITEVEANVTVGLIAVGLGGALLWEMADRFASAWPNGGGGASLIELTFAPAYGIIELPSWILQAMGIPAGTTVKAPKTFGAALNTTLRDLTIAGPGTLGQLLTGAVTRLTKP